MANYGGAGNGNGRQLYGVIIRDKIKSADLRPLLAYRTVAVKQGGLPLGTVLFIPAARGLRMPDGRRHDGYFFVADIGAMRSSQLDLFTGTSKLAWKILGSGTARSRTSQAYIVTDPGIVGPLKAAHIAAADAGGG